MKKYFSVLIIMLMLSSSFAQTSIEDDSENGCVPEEVTVWTWQSVRVGIVIVQMYLPTTLYLPCPQS